MSAMLLSIKPQYAKMIIEGTKKYEFRTRKCREDIKKIIFYATAPKSQVVGEAEIEDVLVGPPNEIWKKTKAVQKKVWWQPHNLQGSRYKYRGFLYSGS